MGRSLKGKAAVASLSAMAAVCVTVGPLASGAWAGDRVPPRPANQWHATDVWERNSQNREGQEKARHGWTSQGWDRQGRWRQNQGRQFKDPQNQGRQFKGHQNQTPGGGWRLDGRSQNQGHGRQDQERWNRGYQPGRTVR